MTIGGDYIGAFIVHPYIMKSVEGDSIFGHMLTAVMCIIANQSKINMIELYA